MDVKGLQNGELLELLDQVTPEDIIGYRLGLSVEAKAIFDEIEERRKLIVVALNKLTPEAIEDLRREMKGRYLVGFHDLNNVLIVLTSIKEINEMV